MKISSQIFFLFIPLFLSSVLLAQPQLMTGFPILDSLDGPTSSTIIADFNNDGDNEILFCVNLNTFTGRVYLTDNTGKNLEGWPKVIKDIPNYFSSAAGDINGDGFIDIVIRVKDSIFVWGYDGSNLQGFPVFYGGGMQNDDFSDALTLYDLDNDGKLEILVNRTTKICVFNFDGSIRNGWPRDISIGNRSTFSLFTVGDLDKDGNAEVIAPVSHFNQSIMKMDSNMIYVLKDNGENFTGFPIESDSGYYFAPSPATIFENPDGNKNFIINSNYSPNFNPFTFRVRTTTYNSNGNIISRFYTKTSYDCFGVQLGKISGSNLDIVVNSIDSTYAFNSSGSEFSNWPVFAPGANVFRASAIAKTSANMNVILGADRQDTIGGFSERRGYLWFFNPDGSQTSWSPLRTPGIQIISPTFCDLNKDGQLDMVFVSLYSTPEINLGTIIYAFTFPGVPYNTADLPWPMYGHDRYRTNQYGFVPPDEPVSVINNNSQIPSSFILYQNYPNPFNPSTEISFAVPKRSFITLKIYDALGKDVFTLTNEYKPAGNYKISFDGSHYPSGVYFYTLNVDGKNIDTKRMVLLK